MEMKDSGISNDSGRSESLVVTNTNRDKAHNNKTSPHSLKADGGVMI